MDEGIKLENKTVFYSKKTFKDFMKTEEHEEDYRKNNTCRIFENEIISDKVKNYCHRTGKN